MILNTSKVGLVLRSYREDDAELYSKSASNYYIWKFMRDEFPYPCSVNHAEDYIKGIVNAERLTNFAISFNDRFIGDIHLSLQTDILRHSGFLSYWLSEDYWGKGIITEAVKVITRYGFEELGLKRIFARVFENNIGS